MSSTANEKRQVQSIKRTVTQPYTKTCRQGFLHQLGAIALAVCWLEIGREPPKVVAGLDEMRFNNFLFEIFRTASM